MTDLKNVMRVAEQVRNWAERLARQRPFSLHRSDELSGMCAIASARLFEELKAEGIGATLCYNHNHCFVIVSGYVVDVTATQFGWLDSSFKFTRVLLRRSRELHRYRSPNSSWGAPWGVMKRFKSVRGLRREQVRVGWPPEQIALEPVLGD